MSLSYLKVTKSIPQNTNLFKRFSLHSQNFYKNLNTRLPISKKLDASEGTWICLDFVTKIHLQLGIRYFRVVLSTLHIMVQLTPRYSNVASYFTGKHVFWGFHASSFFWGKRSVRPTPKTKKVTSIWRLPDFARFALFSLHLMSG